MLSLNQLTIQTFRLSYDVKKKFSKKSGLAFEPNYTLYINGLTTCDQDIGLSI